MRTVFCRCCLRTGPSWSAACGPGTEPRRSTSSGFRRGARWRATWPIRSVSSTAHCSTPRVPRSKCSKWMTACERPACVGVMSGDPQSKQEFADIAAQLAAAEQAALPLFGLTAKFSGPRSLNGVGRRGDVVDHVRLSHGLLSEKRVDVSVVGPLHGPVPGGEWAIDPLPMIAGEHLDHAGVELASGAELERGAEDV